LSAPPDPLAAQRGPTSKERGGKGGKGKGEGERTGMKERGRVGE